MLVKVITVPDGIFLRESDVTAIFWNVQISTTFELRWKKKNEEKNGAMIRELGAYPCFKFFQHFHREIARVFVKVQ